MRRGTFVLVTTLMFLKTDLFLVPYVAGVFFGCANVNASVTAGLNSQKVEELGSLCRRLDLSPVSNVCEAAPISLFWAPTDSTNYRRYLSNFPSSWLANWQLSFLNRPIIARTYSRRCFADGLNQKFSSTTFTTVKATRNVKLKREISSRKVLRRR